MAKQSLILRSIYVQWLIAQIFPQLHKWPVNEWPVVLDKAVEKDLDRYEQLGIMAAVVFVTWLLKPESAVDKVLAQPELHTADLG